MQATIEKRAERRTMPRKVEAKRAAVAWGTLSREMTMMMPTTWRLTTTVRAVRTVSRFSMKVTGKPWVRAKSGSHETVIQTRP